MKAAKTGERPPAGCHTERNRYVIKSEDISEIIVFAIAHELNGSAWPWRTGFLAWG